MLGQLHDAGNTTTLAHYLKLLESAFLVSGLEPFKRGRQKKKGSRPKLIIWNNGLINAVTGGTFESARSDHSWWDRLVENGVGAHLTNQLAGLRYSIYYLKKRSDEVDFVVEKPGKTWAIEVKSGSTQNTKGLEKFHTLYPEARQLAIGYGGISLEEFFNNPPVTHW